LVIIAEEYEIPLLNLRKLEEKMSKKIKWKEEHGLTNRKKKKIANLAA
jgi:hypothetical protein